MVLNLDRIRELAADGDDSVPEMSMQSAENLVTLLTSSGTETPSAAR